ncbi:MAG: polyphosphate polymerase domain-containing protein [Lachnospiraceae bacterium]|nr:polyphosphate polymerase domain-containing protein [Lachnospiraceae bacterium]
MDGYRRELKFIISDALMLDIRNRIGTIMKPDEHQSRDHYRVRSIYFDNPSHTCIRENLAGVSTREKYRIRTYDCDSRTIIAEIKIRHRSTVSKMSTPIDTALFDALISGDRENAAGVLRSRIDESGAAGSGKSCRVLEKYLVRIASEAYSPSVMVDYERSAYVYPAGNVRITFDRNVFGSQEYSRMFDNALTGRPALDHGLHILEIKYDEFLPDEIKAVLGGMQLEASSSSKYAACALRFI